MKDAIEVKAHRLVEKRKVMEAGKRKAKEKAKLLKQELQELWVGFSIQKKKNWKLSIKSKWTTCFSMAINVV